ncbi:MULTISPECIES: twin-arginine translocase subunit TatC [unclassified Streptomyces]|uniref:twin-arginine translocase subunit TatC n=1 Tax=unclassified Streptomyces TaxID=2593676 RepID=UPI002DD8ECCD|nr:MULTISPECIES: twin-arginine translocase subunit TatC [unclassified Streptomyces]WSA96187.1 twin-arginine translocase subunit TatC [Streptomyces sp. NBC_01795]WSB80600.1 twin-arginine translocase subunit TatC [Streptomyces sp. NBC_01775]WSS11190.1 twin-arginine translocase subunit TatC [Streptomyces sp. NBC_01186]WSS39900.1 twin-arginine translocase subunit TatC [Streptomyces sp. NBC_01187]
MLKSARKQGKREQDPEGRMPLAEHLRELRNRLMKSVLAILVVTIVAMFYYKQIAEFLMGPVQDSVGCPDGFGESKDGQTCAEITISGLIAPFTLMLKVALTAGVVAASPIWLYQLWGFLAPGLHQHEKKYARSFVGVGAPLFLAGACLAYVILPTAAKALLDFSPEGAGNLIPLDDFLDIVTRLVIVFGLAFELPLLLVLLNVGGVLTGKRLLGWWRAMVLGITVFAAVATPTGDPLTMCALAAPIVILYFGAVGVCLFNDRRRRRTDPYADLDDDEASSLDHTPEAVGATDAVPGPRPVSDDDEPGGPRRLNGYDDAT